MADKPIDWEQMFVRACDELWSQTVKKDRLLRAATLMRDKLIHGSDVEHHAVKEFDQILKDWGIKCLLFFAVALCGVPSFAGSIRNERLYSRIAELRSADPDRFDGNYPFIGRLVRDDGFFDKLYDRWQANPARFEHYHDPLLIRILDGKPRIPPPPPIHPPRPPHFPPILPPDECGPNPPGVVPEPGTLAMLLIGTGIVLLVRRSR